jgi:excisionase family DNA binding protein
LLGADSRNVCAFHARSTPLSADISANRAEIVFADGTNAMNTQDHDNDKAALRPLFYTVAEAARLLRVDRATLYRAIREDAFPAVRVRSRYVIPAVAVERLAADAAETGGCIDVAAIAAGRRVAREAARLMGGQR